MTTTVYQVLLSFATVMVSTNVQSIGKQVAFYITVYHSNNTTCKTTFMLSLSAYNSTSSSVIPFFNYHIVIKDDGMHRFTKFKNIPCMWRGFRTTLSFRKVKVALKPLETVASLLKWIFASY